MIRPTFSLAVAVGALGTIGAGVATAAPATPAQAVVPVVPAATTTAATTSTPPAAATPATTGATTTGPPVAAGPPVLRNLKLPAKVTARQGHARFLVGVRVTTPSTVTAQVFAVKGDTLVRTVTAEATTPGRVYILIEATSEQRYQLPAGTYRIRLQAADGQNRQSNVLQKSVALATTTPRGRLDMDTLPLWRPLARSLRLPAKGGQLVTAIAPRGDSVKAGMRRGDVITAINSLPTLTTGQYQTALRALPAGTSVPVEVRRGTRTTTFQVTFAPDWTPVPDLTAVQAVAVRRARKVMAPNIAQAMYLTRMGKTAPALKLVAAWPRGWQRSAPGQMVQGRIQERLKQPKKALGFYNRALKRDPRMAEAVAAKATILSQQGRNAAATRAFAQALRIDDHDATSAAFQSFSLVREKKDGDALPPARDAVALDATFGEAQIALGVALVLNKQQARGVVALRSGVMLTDNQALAQQVIDQYLEPADK